MAAAIGARLPVHDPSGHMVVDIGGGTAEIAVLSLGGVVAWKSIRAAGAEFDQNLVQYAREHLNLLIGERSAEEVKIALGAATPIADHLEAKLRGRDLVTGLPKEVTVTGAQVREALQRTVRSLIENIQSTIESSPPELVADLYERGILLSGGGALLKGLDSAIAAATTIPVHVADDPLTSVVRGTGIVLDDLDALRDVLVVSTTAQEAHLR